MSLDAIPTIAFSIFKIAILVMLLLYTLFAAIMIRQSELMDKVIDENFEPVLRILVIVHFVFAVGLLLLAFFTL